MLILTSSSDKTFKLWRVIEIQTVDFTTPAIELIQVKCFKGHEGYVRRAIFYKENMVVSCGDDASIRFWSLDTGKCCQVIKKAHQFAVYWLEKTIDH